MSRVVNNVQITDYLTSRILSDVQFMADNGLITPEDAAAIRQRLPQEFCPPAMQPQGSVNISFPAPPRQMPAPSMPTTAASPRFPLKSVGPPPGPPPSGPNGPEPRRPVPPAPQHAPTSHPEFCKACWDYNLDNTEPNDLAFRKYDIIEISEETNEDWWTGICRGRTGLFPSNHVIKIPYDPHIFPTPPESGTSPPSQVAPMPSAEGTLYEKRYAGQPQDQMMAPPIGASPNVVPPGMPNGQGPQDPNKKGKFGKVGGQLGNSLVNGVGFGAGAAVGSGIINAIF